jgi:hypothetical protein
MKLLRIPGFAMIATTDGMMKMAPSSSRAEDIDGGARIVFVPNDTAQLEELRAHVHAHAERNTS